MRHNGASQTLLRPVDWLFLSYHPVQCKNTVPRQLNDRYSAPEPPTTAAPPQNESAESADEVDCIASRRPLWMAAVHRWMRRWTVRPCCLGVWRRFYRGFIKMREDGAIQIFMNERLLFDTEQIPSDTTTSFSSVSCRLYLHKQIFIP